MNQFTVDVKKFGAAGDGENSDTRAFQQAIDACAEQGGGMVFVPPGRYLCGSITLRSCITLHLANGAVVLASRNKDDYAEHRALLFADGAESLVVEGAGTIDGQARDALLRSGASGPESQKQRPDFRPRMLIFNQCQRVRIQSVRFQYGDSWTIHMKSCEDVVIDGITIFNNIHRINSDGIDPDSCRQVRIANCYIVTGDDCIVLKSTDKGGKPCEDVVVTNCTLATGATALKMGTESYGDFRNVHISNCSILKGVTGLGIFIKDGATLERVTFSNISYADLEGAELPYRSAPIIVDLDRRRPDSELGSIRDVLFENIFLQSIYPSIIQGVPESPLENIVVKNITQRVEKKADFSQRGKPGTVKLNAAASSMTPNAATTQNALYTRDPAYLTIAHANDLRVEDCRLYMEPDVDGGDRSVLSLHKISGEQVRHIHRCPTGTANDSPAILRDNDR